MRNKVLDFITTWIVYCGIAFNVMLIKTVLDIMFKGTTSFTITDLVFLVFVSVLVTTSYVKLLKESK